jgi:hypothetical protein
VRSDSFQGSEFEPGDIDMVRRVGAIEVDVPRTIGYFGGIAAAVGLGIIDWPVGVFIAAIPLVKMFNRRGAPRSVRLASQVYEGIALPVGGEAPGTVRLGGKREPSRRPARSRVTR